jgi:hypothetical protein
MTDTELDTSYSALAAALADAGQDNASLLLAMVCLTLIGRIESAEAVLPLIEQARSQLAQERSGEA